MSWEQFATDRILKNEDFKTIKLVGEIAVERQQRMLGHILRKPPSDIMRKVTCDENLARPQQLYKRHGAPRTHWLEDSLNVAMQKFTNDPLAKFAASEEQITLIMQAASKHKL